MDFGDLKYDARHRKQRIQRDAEQRILEEYGFLIQERKFEYAEQRNR